jgi:hypothetical protein
MLSDDQEEVLIRARRGLMKTSIETGAPVVPVYHLGNSRVLKFGPAIIFRGLSRRLRTSLGLVFGLWGLPIPIQHPIHMLVGLPIQPGSSPLGCVAVAVRGMIATMPSTGCRSILNIADMCCRVDDGQLQ